MVLKSPVVAILIILLTIDKKKLQIKFKLGGMHAHYNYVVLSDLPNI